MAWAVRPIEMSAEDQGIRLEVVAAGRFDNRLKLYITLQDIEGDRISGDIGLHEYGVSSPKFGSSGAAGIDIISYDPETRTATLLFESVSSDVLDDSKLTFSVEGIEYNSIYHENYDTGIDLTGLQRDEGITEVTVSRINAYNIRDSRGGELKAADIIRLLEPNMDNINFAGIPGFMISSAGIIDGALHVQAWVDKEKRGFGEHFLLLDSSGDPINADSWFFFELDDSGQFAPDSGHSGYREYVFNVNPDDLGQYRLVSNFHHNEYLDGRWDVTFNAGDSGKTLETDCGIPVAELVLNHMSITPFGITFSADGSYSGPGDMLPFLLSVTVNTEDGDIEMPLTSAGYDWEADVFTIHCDAVLPIDTDMVTSVTVNGERFAFK
jgi:hypothetical protein